MAFGKRALALTVPVWTSTWLSSVMKTPSSSFFVRVRSNAATASLVPPATLACTSGTRSCGTEKATSIGASCVITATPLASPALM